MKKFSLGALVAAGLLMGGLGAGSASAADLGGNCCADLEERIAELEATTARKGNRKVSLTISGWVGEQVMWWDDGGQRGTYVTGLGTTLASHVTFTGQATIVPGWYAGYVLHIEADENDPLATLNQFTSHGPTEVVSGVASVFQSFWFVKSDKLGKVSVGLQSAAGDNAAILVDGSGSLVPANWVLFDNAAFFLRVNGVLTNATWGDLGFCNTTAAGIGGDCVSNPKNIVRYDSPVFAGFSMSADWGQDTYWDVYGRYAGEWNGIKVAATSGWSQVNRCAGDAPTSPLCLNSVGVHGGAGDTGYWQSGLYIEHVATGLFVLGNYGREFLRDLGPGQLGNNLNDQPDHWYVKGGVRERWSSLGHTVLFGEYAKRRDMVGTGIGSAFSSTTGLDDDQADNSCNVKTGANCAFVHTEQGASSEMRQWGFGAVQEIDAAAMSVWVVYRHFDADFTNSVQNQSCNVEDGSEELGSCTNTTHGFTSRSTDTFQLVKFGALINF